MSAVKTCTPEELDGAGWVIVDSQGCADLGDGVWVYSDWDLASEVGEELRAIWTETDQRDPDLRIVPYSPITHDWIRQVQGYGWTAEIVGAS